MSEMRETQQTEEKQQVTNPGVEQIIAVDAGDVVTPSAAAPTAQPAALDNHSISGVPPGKTPNLYTMSSETMVM
ncbi:MAG: hypothetical protein QNK37_35035, partial [Acidobacteriota bacterium]|nr:hypothetical protein [Acidobacteriota bacterium]